MRHLATAFLLAATLSVAACGASDPVQAVRDRPLEARLIDVEARRLCTLQRTTFSDPEAREAFTDGLLAEVDVTRTQWQEFRAELADDPERAAEVSDLFDELCSEG